MRERTRERPEYIEAFFSATPIRFRTLPRVSLSPCSPIEIPSDSLCFVQLSLLAALIQSPRQCRSDDDDIATSPREKSTLGHDFGAARARVAGRFYLATFARLSSTLHPPRNARSRRMRRNATRTSQEETRWRHNDSIITSDERHISLKRHR